jgi:hypothetical protein
VIQAAFAALGVVVAHSTFGACFVTQVVVAVVGDSVTDTDFAVAVRAFVGAADASIFGGEHVHGCLPNLNTHNGLAGLLSIFTES